MLAEVGSVQPVVLTCLEPLPSFTVTAPDVVLWTVGATAAAEAVPLLGTLGVEVVDFSTIGLPSASFCKLAMD